MSMVLAIACCAWLALCVWCAALARSAAYGDALAIGERPPRETLQARPSSDPFARDRVAQTEPTRRPIGSSS